MGNLPSSCAVFPVKGLVFSDQTSLQKIQGIISVAKNLRYPAMPGSPEYFYRLPNLKQLSLVQHSHPVCQGHDLGWIMGNIYHCRWISPREQVQLLPQLETPLGIQVV